MSKVLPLMLIGTVAGGVLYEIFVMQKFELKVRIISKEKYLPDESLWPSLAQDYIISPLITAFECKNTNVVVKWNLVRGAALIEYESIIGIEAKEFERKLIELAYPFHERMFDMVKDFILRINSLNVTVSVTNHTPPNETGKVSDSNENFIYINRGDNVLINLYPNVNSDKRHMRTITHEIGHLLGVPGHSGSGRYLEKNTEIMCPDQKRDVIHKKCPSILPEAGYQFDRTDNQSASIVRNHIVSKYLNGVCER